MRAAFSCSCPLCHRPRHALSAASAFGSDAEEALGGGARGGAGTSGTPGEEASSFGTLATRDSAWGLALGEGGGVGAGDGRSSDHRCMTRAAR